MINNKEACSIAKTHLDSTREYQLEPLHGCNFRQGVYGRFDWDNSWVVIANEKDRSLAIESSYIVLVCKESGVILYTGYAYDEG